MAMSVGVLDHYNVSTRKLKETVQFYEDVLGFKNGARPPFNFPGAWLYSGNHPVLHLNDIAGTDKEQPIDRKRFIENEDDVVRPAEPRRIRPR